MQSLEAKQRNHLLDHFPAVIIMLRVEVFNKVASKILIWVYFFWIHHIPNQYVNKIKIKCVLYYMYGGSPYS